ncbi:MAG: hypothetical protein AAGF99_01950 [Bacteroidota bacterium]
MESALVPLVAGAVALLLIISGLVLWVSRSRAARPKRAPAPRPQDDLRSLGIVDIRPMARAAADTNADPQPIASEPLVAEPIASELIASEPIAPEPVAVAVDRRVTDSAGSHADEAAAADGSAAEMRAIDGAVALDRALVTDGSPPSEDGIELDDLPEATLGTQGLSRRVDGVELPDGSGAASDLPDPPYAATGAEGYGPTVLGEEEHPVLLDDGSALRDGEAVVLDQDTRSALEETVAEELGAAIAEVEGASETTPLRPTHAAAFGDVDLLDDYDDAAPIRFPDPREFDDELDLPLPLPGDDLDLVRRPESHALSHLIESIWNGMRAQTVALLRHDASTLHYKVEALKSEHPAVVGVEEFASAGSALRGIRGQQGEQLPMLLKGASLDALGYYSDLGAVGRAYVQPLTDAEAPSLLLVVDTAPEDRAYAAAEKGLLRQFASVLGHLAAQEVPAWFVTAAPAEALTDLPAETVAPAVVAPVASSQATPQETSQPDEETTSEDRPAETTNDAPDDAPEAVADDAALPAGAETLLVGRVEDEAAEVAVADPAPADEPEGIDAEPMTPVARRVIVAEEMERSRARQYPLALALVHRTDAEAVAAGGPAAVEQAEATLRQHLDHTLALADGRVEPFGELLYGVFYYGRAADVEAWVELVRTTPAAGGETLPLTIGVALYGGRHQTSDQLRGDAVQALSDAYDAQVGCVILE